MGGQHLLEHRRGLGADADERDRARAISALEMLPAPARDLVTVLYEPFSSFDEATFTALRAAYTHFWDAEAFDSDVAASVYKGLVEIAG